MNIRKSELTKGGVLLAGFAVVLVILFLPLFNGKNVINYLDALYNSISKGSVYYIPSLKEDAEAYSSKTLEVDLKITDKTKIEKIADLFARSGATVNVAESSIYVSGNLKDIVLASLADAEFLFHNQADQLVNKYNYNEREVLYNWWLGYNALDKELTRQKLFADAKFVSSVQKKALECSYNYYRIEPLDISDEVWLVILSLIFYVVYTVWFGFAIMYFLSGLGFQIEG